MAATYEPISSTTLGGNSTGVTFSTIPSGFTDLIVVVAGKSTANQLVYMQLNGDTAGNYSTTMLGDIYGANSGRQVNHSPGVFVGAFDSTNSSSLILNLMSYASTSVYKTSLVTVQYGVQSIQKHVGLWRNTSAVSSLYIYMAGGAQFTTGATFSLFGIKAA